MGFLKLLLPAAIACSCNSLANMFWKMRFDKEPLSFASIGQVLSLMASWHIWVGVACYGISMLLFFYMLSNFKLSTIMPVTCMTYVFNLAIARFVFHETIEKAQLAGTLIVVIGLLILSQGQVDKV